MCGALMGLPRVSPGCSNASEMVDANTLNLPDLFSTVDFETISWKNTGNAVFKVDPGDSHCCCSPALHELEGWIKSVES